MSEAASAPPSAPKRDYSRFNPFVRNDFMLRRIHSLTGLMPLTLFLCEHLFTNSRSTQGPDSFNGAVKFMTGLPLFMLIEWGGIYIPLMIHLILGIWIARTAHSNIDRYKYTGNWRYLFQRVSGIVIVLFLIVHLGHWRYGVRLNYTDPTTGDFHVIASRHYTPYTLDEKEFPQEYSLEYAKRYTTMRPQISNDPVAVQKYHMDQKQAMDVYAREDNMFYAMQEAFSNWGWLTFYVFGLAAACYHTGNGLWTFTITWGFIRNPKAQARFSDICLAFGMALFVLGVFSLAGFKWGEQMSHALHAIGFEHTQF